MNAAERGALGGQRRAQTLTADQRKDIASQGHLAAAVSTVVRRVAELSPSDRDRLAEVLTTTPAKGDTE